MSARRSSQRGYALILTLLVLTLLTFLGLALATTSSTELQIAVNYRWKRQAWYNAEAGLEVGRSVLRTLNWQAVLPEPRTTTWVPADDPADVPAPTGIWDPPSDTDAVGLNVRTFESGGCDGRGNGVGYGVVLDDGNAVYQNVSDVADQPVNGAFTVWVRRPVEIDDGGNYSDHSADSDVLILTAEGVAPFQGEVYAGGASGYARSAAARVVLEMVLSRAASTGQAQCGTRSGQAGGGPEGAGYGGCAAITGEGMLAGLGSAPSGTAAEKGTGS